MTADQSAAVIFGSMLGTNALLLLISKRFRDDMKKVFQLEKSTLRVAIEHPFATLALILSLVLPVFLMGLPL